MKTVGIILAILVILGLVVLMIFIGKTVHMSRKQGDASEIRAERKNNNNTSVRSEADMRRIEEIMEQEEEKAAEVSRVSSETVTEFTMDWSYRKAEEGLQLTGLHDDTDVNWIMLIEGGNLALAVEQYIAVKQYIHENGTSYRAYGAAMWSKDITHLRISSQKEIDSLKGFKDDIFEKCRENGIRIIMEDEENSYYDFVDQCEYEVYVSATWPGSMDDSDTYGTLELVKR